MSAKFPIDLQPEVKQQLFPNYPDERQIANFFATLGRAVTVWQTVETALYMVFERATEPNMPGASAAAFHAIQTFTIKLAATDAAVRFRIVNNRALLDEWASLRSDADAKSIRRNQFVHFSTYIMVDEKRPNDRVRLEPQIFDTRHSDGGPKLRMSEIDQITARFTVLSDNLTKFSRKIPPSNVHVVYPTEALPPTAA